MRANYDCLPISKCIVSSSGFASLTIHWKDILFPFNAQHDCIRSACRVTDTEFVYQERRKTTISKFVIVHDSDPVYVINMHSLHNPHLLRQALPRSHSKPTSYCLSHDAERLKIAAELRILGPQKRAETRDKAKATRARNKAKKIAAGTRATAAGISPEQTGERDVSQAGHNNLGPGPAARDHWLSWNIRVGKEGE
jgi:hypothetical protein